MDHFSASLSGTNEHYPKRLSRWFEVMITDSTCVAPDSAFVMELVLCAVLRNVSQERGADLLVTVGRDTSSATRKAITVVAIPFSICEMINHNRKTDTTYCTWDLGKYKAVTQPIARPTTGST